MRARGATAAGGNEGPKEGLRKAARAARKSLAPSALAEASARIRTRAESLEEYRRARLLVCYCAIGDEVQTREIIEGALREGKRVAVPVTDPAARRLSFSEIGTFAELAPGYHGIPEPRPEGRRPVSLSDADLVLLPVVGWDERGNRLGYGAGYFDRALAGAKVTTVGLALECQRVPDISAHAGDVPLDVVVTEERVVRRPRS